MYVLIAPSLSYMNAVRVTRDVRCRRLSLQPTQNAASSTWPLFRNRSLSAIRTLNFVIYIFFLFIYFGFIICATSSQIASSQPHQQLFHDFNPKFLATQSAHSPYFQYPSGQTYLFIVYQNCCTSKYL